jgi:hypothetical protein
MGFDLLRVRSGKQMEDFPPDVSELDRSIIASVKQYTMTSNERLTSLIYAVRHIVHAEVPGAIAECGVWKGGSMMAVAGTLLNEGVSDRDLFLYDTFEGMSEPTEQDESFDNVPAAVQLAQTPRTEGVWCYSPLDEVRENLARTKYPQERIHYVKGKIEETIPENNPPRLALLRLDTDWYESTRHELQHLFPLLACGGILIIDDYGHWQGARKAVDEYLRSLPRKYYLHRIDFTGRLLVKC